ncbi:MAG: hypothetical protein K1V86_10555 [Duncaniella sp.]
MKESESISHCRAGVTDGFARARAIEWFEAVNLRLSEGGIVKFSPKGFSMWPVIRPDTDTVYISRTAEYSRSDIVLAFCEHPRGVFLHRISQVLPDGVILMGDTNLYQTERCRYADVIGKIVGIERDGYEVSGSVMNRLAAFMQRMPAPMRRLYVRCLNMYLKIEHYGR